MLLLCPHVCTSQVPLHAHQPHVCPARSHPAFSPAQGEHSRELHQASSIKIGGGDGWDFSVSRLLSLGKQTKTSFKWKTLKESKILRTDWECTAPIYTHRRPSFPLQEFSSFRRGLLSRWLSQYQVVHLFFKKSFYISMWGLPFRVPQTRISFQFWRLEVWMRGNSMLGSFWGLSPWL